MPGARSEPPGEQLRVALLGYRGNPFSGGQGVYLHHLSRELHRLGHHVEVLSGPPYPDLAPGVPLVRIPSLDLYRPDDPFRVPAWHEFRGPVDVLEFGLMCTAGFPEPLTFSLRARRLLRQRQTQFDLVHDNQCLGYGILGIARDGLPVVATIHHPVTVDRRLELAHAPTWARRMTLRRWYGFVRMQKRVVPLLPRIITVSESSARDLTVQMGARPEQLAVVPAGVDTDHFRPLPGIRRRPGRIMTTASADVPLKGLLPLIEAVAKVRTERPAELVVVGRPREGSLVPRTIERLGLAGAVHLMGEVDGQRMVELYAEAEVAVVPSLYEGFSLPAVEAMACGVPLVATTGGALPEVVGRNGETALLVPPGDPGALAVAIGELLDDGERATRIGAAGRARVLQRYTWQQAARATVDQYRAVLDARVAQVAPRVLTVDFRRLRAQSGDLVLDLGCGGGRHAFAAHRAGTHVVALDRDAGEVAGAHAMLAAMRDEGEAPASALGSAVRGDAFALPFPDGTFDRVIAAEVLEHLPGDQAAMAEASRVLRPGGTLAVTVPRWWPEQVCWALSDKYHAPAAVGGHVRIYRAGELATRLRRTGLRVVTSHHAHALHAPYWWLKCLMGLSRDDALPVRLYHRFLVWDITTGTRAVRVLERALNPLLGKSLVVYLEKPAEARRAARLSGLTEREQPVLEPSLGGVDAA